MRSGLKSWLTFGASIAQNKQDTKAIEATPPPNRLRALLRTTHSETNANEITTEELDKGPPLKSAVRTHNAMMKMKIAKGDDKLTRKAEEQAAKVWKALLVQTYIYNF